MADKFPDSPYPNDVPNQLVGEYRGYVFRVYQAPRGVGYEKEVWEKAPKGWWDKLTFNQKYYWQGLAPSKAQAVQEIKDRIDQYYAEGTLPGTPARRTAVRTNPSVKALKNKLLK